MTAGDAEEPEAGFGLAGLADHLRHGIAEVRSGRADVPPAQASVAPAQRPTRPLNADAVRIADRIIAAARRQRPDDPPTRTAQPVRSDVPAADPQRTMSATTTAPERVAVVVGPREESIELRPGDSLTFGRADGPDRVRVPNGEVSGTHLRLEMMRDGLFATDLRSTNGTEVLRGGSMVALPPDVAFQLRTGDAAYVVREHRLFTVVSDGLST